MKTNLFLLSFKEVRRSSSFGRSVATTVMLAFLALYFTLVFLALGTMVIPKALAEKFPGVKLTGVLNSFLLVYFAVDLVVRQLLQSLPTISFKPFIVQNIKRSRIAAYLLNRSVFHFFNLLPLFLLFPLFFRIVLAEQEPLGAYAWLAGCIGLIFTNHFLTTYLKWWINESSYGFYVFAAVFLGLYGLNFFGIVDLTGMFGQLLDLLIREPYILPAFLFLPVLFYFLNWRYLRANLYLNLVEKKQKESTVRDYSWMSRFGEYGKFISLDVRMIWRNKRPRTQFMMTIFFLLYGFMLYKNRGGGIGEFELVLGAMFLTGMFSISIGQFFPAWHARYYPMLMTQNFKMKQFLQAFYNMNVIVSFVYFLVTLAYGFLDIRIVYFNTALFFYHIGVNLNLILWIGSASKKAVDLGGSAMFNYQGVGAAQWLFAFPLIFGPILVFFLFRWMTGSIPAILIMAAIGVLGIILQPQLINYFSKLYNKQKHRMIRDYKNS